MKCKNCGKEFHYCTSCSPDYDYDLGCCSQKCSREYYNWDKFRTFYYKLLNFASEGNKEKAILENCEYDLWSEWCGLFTKE